MAVNQLLGSYSPESVIIVLSNDQFTHQISGYSDGSFINISRVVPHATLYTGADASNVRVVRAVRNFDISVTLHQSSESNDVLSQLIILDEAARDNSNLFQINIKDDSGRTQIFAPYAFIGTTPDAGFGTDVTEREWVLHAIGVNDPMIGGNAPFTNSGYESIVALGNTPAEAWNPIGE